MEKAVQEVATSTAKVTQAARVTHPQNIDRITRATPDLSPRAVAVLYWEHYAASTSSDREQRLRAERGGLSDHAEIVEDALRDDRRSDDVLAAIIDVLVSERPVAMTDGLAYLAAGPIEDRWNSGDT
jgi:hypothetical protein